MTTKSGSAPTRSATVNLRMQAEVRDLIDRAAKAAGKTRTDFMLEASRREAETVLSDETYFALEKDQFDAFVAALDAPPAENPQLRRLLQPPAPWDQ